MKRPEAKHYYVKGAITSSECVDKYHYIKALNNYIDNLEKPTVGEEKFYCDFEHHNHQVVNIGKCNKCNSSDGLN